MVFADLFSTSFLFSTAIIIILIGGIFAYVNYRMVEQDHKLSSMVSLVSILAQDLQFVKSKLHANATASTNANASTNENETNNLQYASQIMGGSDLISVSDDEEEKEDEEQDGDEEQDEEQDDEDEETYSDDESYEEEEEVDDSTNHIKLLNLTLANENFEDEHYIEDLSSPEREDDIKIIHIENNLTEELETFKECEPTTHIEVPPPTEAKISMDDMNFLKSVTITDLGEIEDANSSKTDYKKMSINKLREIVVSKGLVTDASKLKKPEILNLLGDE